MRLFDPVYARRRLSAMLAIFTFRSFRLSTKKPLGVEFQPSQG
jgi:hypothetical protein